MLLLVSFKLMNFVQKVSVPLYMRDVLVIYLVLSEQTITRDVFYFQSVIIELIYQIRIYPTFFNEIFRNISYGSYAFM